VNGEEGGESAPCGTRLVGWAKMLRAVLSLSGVSGACALRSTLRGTLRGGTLRPGDEGMGDEGMGDEVVVAKRVGAAVGAAGVQ
jgi:hypothetical protein